MVKTRFAPSPTGYLHVGGLRTALYCYLFAKKNKGTFVLRIEDTDQERYVEGAKENLIKTLDWMGLEYEEGPLIEGGERGDCGPYIQSERTEIYREYANKLIECGQAYRCFCSKERLDEMRERQKANKEAPMYDRKCLDLPESEINEHLEKGTSFVLRQKMPYEIIKFKDIIRGNVQFDGKTIDDQVLMKSDGFPTYHLANVVDDHLMEITHVIRGEEWLPSTPKHIALYKAFGWEPPQFAHLPLLLNPDRTKLSKRQGHVAVEDYIQEGYLKESILNFVVFLGWNPGSGEEKEIFTLKELEEVFSLEKVHKSGAVFNIEKLDWFNWRWQKENYQKELESLAKKIDPESRIEEPRKDQFQYVFTNTEAEKQFIEKRGEMLLAIIKAHLSEENIEPLTTDREKLHKILITIEEKILRNPKEVLEHIDFYQRLPEYSKELLTHEKMRVNFEVAYDSLTASLKALSTLDDWELFSVEEALLKVVEELGVKNGQVFWPLRSALSGLQFSPGVFEIAWVLGKEETLRRIEIALKKLK